MNTTSATAVLAEDEPLLAAGLRAELARLWPALSVVADVRHGNAAVEQALALCPDVMFLDIRMPGLSGLEAAQAIVQGWDAPGAPPLMVFVTAYDQYAVQAFEQCALDYVLKPVTAQRLARTAFGDDRLLLERYTWQAVGSRRPARGCNARCTRARPARTTRPTPATPRRDPRRRRTHRTPWPTPWPGCSSCWPRRRWPGAPGRWPACRVWR